MKPSVAASRPLNLVQLLDEPVDWRYKSFPSGDAVPLKAVSSQGWKVLDGTFLPPVMVLKESALRHNLQEMAEYTGANHVSLAPHVKTHMAPQLFQMQLDAGAWGLTVANVSQARIWRHFGAQRIIIANELVDRESVVWVATALEADSALEVFCLVDSVAGVSLLERALAEVRPGRRLKVLVEVGPMGGRTGCRTDEEAILLAEAVSGAQHLSLAGVECFEGVVHDEVPTAALDAVDQLIWRMRSIAVTLDSAGHFARSESEEVIISAGGSAYPDRVVSGLGEPWRLSAPVRVVLRSGCYLTHDADHYAHLSPFGSRLPETGPLDEALEIWGAVLSTPEPGLALLGFGKRDVPYDLGLPIPRQLKSPGGQVRPLTGNPEIFELNDQHAFMRLSRNGELEVGDLVGCGISHPCTAFDKWRLIPVVDHEYHVLDAILTYF